MAGRRLFFLTHSLSMELAGLILSALHFSLKRWYGGKGRFLSIISIKWKIFPLNGKYLPCTISTARAPNFRVRNFAFIIMLYLKNYQLGSNRTNAAHCRLIALVPSSWSDGFPMIIHNKKIGS